MSLFNLTASTQTTLQPSLSQLANGVLQVPPTHTLSDEFPILHATTRVVKHPDSNEAPLRRRDHRCFALIDGHLVSVAGRTAVCPSCRCLRELEILECKSWSAVSDYLSVVVRRIRHYNDDSPALFASWPHAHLSSSLCTPKRSPRTSLVSCDFLPPRPVDIAFQTLCTSVEETEVVGALMYMREKSSTNFDDQSHAWDK